MSKTIGRSATVEISDNGSSWTAIGEVSSAEPSFSTDMADETTNDSAGYKEEQPADSQMSLSVSGKYDSTDPGQAALMVAAFTKAKKYYRFRPKVGAPEIEWIFQGYCPDFSVPTETGSVEDFNCTINSSGAVDKQAQT